MARTTVDIDTPVLKEVKRIQKRSGKSLGRVVSELLADAVGREKAGTTARPPFRWISSAMGTRVDLTDKEAVRAALGEKWGSKHTPRRRRP